MKITAAIAASALAAASAFGGLKVGTVDMLLLVRNHSSYETNKELLTNTEKDYRKELEAMKQKLDEMQEEGRKLAEELQNPMLAAAAKEKSEKELAAVQRRFVQQQQKMRERAMDNQQELAKMEATLLKSQASDLKKRVADFADKNGYDLIVDASAAIFATKDLDVTDEVLKSMGVDPKAARAKEKDEGK